MKTIALAFTLLLSVSAWATNTINLSGSTANLGALPQDHNGAVSATYHVQRTKRTAEVVTVKFTLNYAKPACTRYAIKYSNVGAISQKNCLSRLDGTYECSDVSFDGFEIPSRVCTAQGMVLATSTQTLELNFKKAITLTPNAKEVFAINITQKNFKGTENALKAKSIRSASVYKTKVSGRVISFKAD